MFKLQGTYIQNIVIQQLKISEKFTLQKKTEPWNEVKDNEQLETSSNEVSAYKV